MKRRMFLPLLLFLIPSTAFAQPSLSNELSVGLGVTFPRESDPLNVPGESQLPACLGASLGYRKYVTDLFAVGLRLVGNFNSLKNYTVTKSGGTPQNVDFSLTSAHLALDGLLLLSESRSMNPFATLMVAYATGGLSNSTTGSLNYQGVTFGGSVGLRIRLSDSMNLALEGIALLGSAKWKQAPFVNSSSSDFNPSSISLLASVLFGME